MATDQWNLFRLFSFQVYAPFKDVVCNLLFDVGRSLLDIEWKGSWPTVEILTLNRLRKVKRCLCQSTRARNKRLKPVSPANEEHLKPVSPTNEAAFETCFLHKRQHLRPVSPAH